MYAGRVIVGALVTWGADVIFYPAGSILLLERGGELEQAIGTGNIMVVSEAEVTASSAILLSN
jgi:hypothetical protein